MLDLTQLRGHKEHVERRLGASEFDASQEDFTVDGEALLSFDVEKDGKQYRLVGGVKGLLSLPCSRCLEPIAWPVDAEFDIRYRPAAAAETQQEREITGEELSVAFFEGELIDLGELAREQFYLALPMKPLCRVDCQGLCSECGANRNAVACGCERHWVDPRLEALRDLLPKGGPKTS